MKIGRAIDMYDALYASHFLISVHFRNMFPQRHFAVECFLAVVTLVAEVTREVDTFYVVPDIYLL